MTLGLTLGIILLSLFAIHAVTRWQATYINPTEDHAPELVLLQPLRCATIPWRSEWAEKNNAVYTAFPVNEERVIIQQYYAARDIPVLGVELMYRSPTPACSLCGCPDPFVFALLVSPPDSLRVGWAGATTLDKTSPTVFTGKFYRQSGIRPLVSVTEKECDALWSIHPVIDAWAGSPKDACYILAGIVENDLAVCEKMSTLAGKETCYHEIAYAQQNPETCSLILTRERNENCLISLAGVTGNAALCDTLSGATAHYFCALATQPR